MGESLSINPDATGDSGTGPLNDGLNAASPDGRFSG